MPVFNGEAFLGEAIESILRQTLRDFELLIVDDASTDGSQRAIRAFRDSRIRLLVSEKNRGLAGARNYAIAHAQGEYIAFLDCDDRSEASRLERQARFLDLHADIGVLGSWTDVFGARTGPCIRCDEPPAEIDARMLFEDPLTTSSVMLRRVLLADEPGPFDSRFDPAEDYRLWARLARKTRIAILRSVLAEYRIHANQTSMFLGDRYRAVRGAIYREQLSALGLTPSERQLIIHDALTHGEAEDGRGFFQEAISWMRSIALANASIERYDRIALGKILSSKAFGLAHRIHGDFHVWALYNMTFAGREFGLPWRERALHAWNWLKCWRATRRHNRLGANFNATSASSP
jgi:glycosyltransferase involved in cell wall biosynthesis